MDNKIIFVPMCCDFLHIGHINILNKSSNLGEVTVLLMTDKAMRKYKRDPAMPYSDRKIIIESLRQVSKVIPCDGPDCYPSLARKHKPDIFVHGDDWKTGPQQSAREELIKICNNYGGEILEPVYTKDISSSKQHTLFKCSIQNASHTGILLRTAFNDIKRDTTVVSKETEVEKNVIDQLVLGYEFDGFNIDTILRLLNNTYPIPKHHLIAENDTSDFGAWFMFKSQTKSSARVFNRTNSYNHSIPYYRYMDTATSSLAPFKPELIEMLVEVKENNPKNPLVVMNKGHLLGQLTFFIGPVNFYWNVSGVLKCKEMNTGDSCLITPYIPHSFTSRDLNQYSAIVAVTYSGNVREVLPQLLHLSSNNLLKSIGDIRKPETVFISRIRRFLELCGKDEFDILKLLSDNNIHTNNIQDIFYDENIYSKAIPLLSKMLGVEEKEFIVNKLTEDQEVTFKRFVYSGNPGKFSFAYAKHMHDIGGYQWFLSEGVVNTEYSQFFIYIYNHGDVSINVEWNMNNITNKQILESGSSVVFKPFININLETDKQAKIVVFKAAGFLSKSIIEEISSFAQIGRENMITNVTKWF